MKKQQVQKYPARTLQKILFQRVPQGEGDHKRGLGTRQISAVMKSVRLKSVHLFLTVTKKLSWEEVKVHRLPIY